jgi:hypothetical protein
VVWTKEREGERNHGSRKGLFELWRCDPICADAGKCAASSPWRRGNGWTQAIVKVMLFTGSCARENMSLHPKCCACDCAVRASASKVKLESGFGGPVCLCVAGGAAMTEGEQKRLMGCLEVFKEPCYRNTNLTILRVASDVLVAFHRK